MADLAGTTGNDTLNGTAADDQIRTGGGTDVVNAGGGNDWVNCIVNADGTVNYYTYSGSATIDGGTGNDFLYGTTGNDVLKGGIGDDYLNGSGGKDQLEGGAGNDALYGGTGNDTYLFAIGAGIDKVNDYDSTVGNADVVQFTDVKSTELSSLERQKDDLILNYGSADRLTVAYFFISVAYRIEQFKFSDGVVWDEAAIKAHVITNGTVGDDFISGYNDGPNQIFGLTGNDTLSGGAGNDILSGGDGNDKLYDQTSGSDTLLGGLGDDYLSTYTSTGNDSLDGGAGNDSLYGGTGGDTLIGGDGNDYLDGFDGNNSLEGGVGNDTLYGGTGGDTLIGGDGNDYLNGFDGNNSLEGGVGNDTLWGGGGNDTLSGGTGFDVLWGGNGDDTYKISSRDFYLYDTGGADTAIVSTSFVKLPASVETVTYTNGAQVLPYWIDDLLAGDAARFSTLLGSAKTMNFTFPTSLPSYDTSTADAVGYLPFNTLQQAFARLALNYVASVVGLSFVETSVAAAANTITFANNTQIGSAGYASHPSDSLLGNDLFLSRDQVGNLTPADGSYAALTLIHELGHSLGLKHPFSHPDADGDIGEGPYLPTTEENTTWTVMSYTGAPAQYHLIYSPLDIAALQYLYGPSKTSRTGNDTYTLSTAAPNFIWDGAGTDTLSAGSQTQAVTLYLEPGYWGYVGSKAANITAPGQVTVNFGTVVENVIGGSGNDTLTGNDANNSLDGGAGNDTLYGGAGDDFFDWDAANRGGNDAFYGGTGNDIYVLDSSLDSVIESSSEGTDTVWVSFSYSIATLPNIENLYAFGLTGVTLTGNAASNYLAGTSGNDTIDGGAGTDAVSYSGVSANYSITTTASGVTIVGATDGTDTLRNVEYAVFADRTVTLSYSDSTAPTVSTFSPIDEATGIAIGSNITLTFSEAIQRGTGNIILKTTTGATVATYDAATSTNLSISGSTLTINPTADLTYSTGYKVEFAAGTIKDLAGNSYAGTTSYNFTTANNGIPVATSATVSAVEDTAKTGTLAGTDPEGSTLTFAKVADPSHGTVTISASTGAYVYTPASNYNGADSFTFKVNDGTADSATSTLSITVSAVNDAPTGSVIISGIATQGQILIAVSTLADADGLGTISYQWKAAGVNMAGATGGAIILAEAQVGKAISVTVSYTDGYGTLESSTSAATGVVANVNDSPTGNITIAGTPTQGQTLTATNGLADLDGLGTLIYQWKASGSAISGATGSTLALTEAQVGKAITVVASYTDGHGTVESVSSNASAAVANINDSPTGSVTITGTASRDLTLTAANTLADPDGLGTISYQWKANGVNISSATASIYKLTQSEVGKTVTVTASYTDLMGTAESVSSLATSTVTGINTAPTGNVTISGTATQGQTLTAANTLADADGLGTIGYQWQAAGVSISGATFNTFTLTQAEVGKVITVTGSYTDAMGTAESKASIATALVLDATAPTVTTLSPIDEATGVGVDGNIVVTFNEAIQRGSGTIILKNAAGVVVANYDATSSTNLSISGNTLTINPSKDFDVFASYKLEIDPTAIRDLAGNGYLGLSDYNFKTQATDGMYQFFAVAFNAAPGEVYMGQVADAYNAGMTLQDIVNVFTTKSQFTSTYAESLTHQQVATLLVDNVVKNSAAETVKAGAVNEIVAALDAGWSRGDVIYRVFGVLAAVPVSDLAWGNTAKQFQNEIAVTRYYTEVMSQTATDLPTLRSIIASVDQNTDVSTPEHIATLIGVALHG